MASEFPFVQFEFGFLLGPTDGRYLVRPAPDAEPSLVVVLGTLGAPQRRFLRRRRPPSVSGADPAPVPTARATLIRVQPLESRAEADAWLAGIRRDRQARDAEVERALGELNDVVRAHRAAAGDPYARDVSRTAALVTRVGYGSGEEVADGRFSEAFEVAQTTPRKRRLERLSPQEHLAAILGGREPLLPCEELVLRARADLAADRPREGALQARIALESLLAELRGGSARFAEEVTAERDLVSQAANAALEGDPSPELQAAVERAVERMERALRRHRLGGEGGASRETS